MTIPKAVKSKVQSWPVLAIFGLSALIAVGAGFAASLPVWNISEVRIYGNDYLSVESLDQAAETARGQNIWFLKRGRLRQQIKRLIPVQEVRFGFAFPGTLIVRIREKKPYLLLDQPPELLVADSAGQVLAGASAAGGEPADFGQRPELLALPLVRGLPPLARGQRLPAADWPALVEISSAWQGSRPDLPIIIQLEPGGYVLVIADSLPVRLGADRLKQKMADLAAILGSEPAPLERFASLDLRFPENYVVKYRPDGNFSQGQDRLP